MDKFEIFNYMNIPKVNNVIAPTNMENAPLINNEESLIKCTYFIKDYNETQIINYRYKTNINGDIENKTKIWNNNRRERVIYKAKFNKLGLNTIYFIVEKKLINMRFLFCECSSLKQIKFIAAKTENVTDMALMFFRCKELEYIDLSDFNTSKAINMGSMFDGCHKLKEIKGINQFNTSNVTNGRYV